MRKFYNLPQNAIPIPDASQYSHLEMQGISLGFVDGIFLQYTRSATAVTQAQNGTIETETGVAQVRITRLLQFEIVMGGIEVCHAVWQGRETQRCIAGSDNLQGILAIFIGQFDIRTVLMVAVVLRTGIVGKLILHAALIPSYRTRLLAVRIILPRSPAIPFHLVLSHSWHLQHQTQTRKFRQIALKTIGSLHVDKAVLLRRYL